MFFTKRSTNPWVAGCHGADVLWIIPLFLTKVWNSSFVNILPLSLIICFTTPNWANICLNTSIVLEAVMEFITCTSGHFECASTAIRNMFPIKGPAKSIWIRSQGAEGHSQGCSEAFGGAFWFTWHPEHFLANCSMSLSSLGHQKKLLLSSFIFTMPKCPTCSSSSTLFLSLMGIITRMPHIGHLFWTDSSFLRMQNGFSLSSWGLYVHPFNVKSRTFDRVGSQPVSRSTSLALTSRLSICDKLYISTESLSGSSSLWEYGSRDSPSQFACDFEYSIS